MKRYPIAIFNVNKGVITPHNLLFRNRQLKIAVTPFSAVAQLTQCDVGQNDRI